MQSLQFYYKVQIKGKTECDSEWLMSQLSEKETEMEMSM